MYQLERTNSLHAGFRELTQMLDQYLAVINGEEDEFFSQFNQIENLQQVVVVLENGHAVGCGAIKSIEEGCVEIKRMFVLPAMRGKNVASLVLAELEAWASDMACPRLVLETAKALEPAVQLYLKNGYSIIPNYGQYAGVTSSVCFEKILKGI